MLRYLRALNIIAPVVAVALLGTTACRSGLRPQASAGDPVSVEMRVVGLKDVDRGRNELVYTLSGCGDGKASGTKGADNVVKFQTMNVRKEDRCDLRVQSDKADIGVASWFAEEGLMYEARRIPITSSEGKLTGVAIVQQLYATPPTISGAPPATIWKLMAPVKGPKAFVDLCTCTIGCLPSPQNNVSKLDITTDKSSGLCQFANVIKPELTKIDCSKIMVQCGGEFFVGAYPAGTTTNGSQAKENTLPEIKLQAGVPEELSDTTIEVVVPN